MIKEQMNKIKKMFQKKEGEQEENAEENKTNKRKIENIAVFLIILIVTLIAINAILSGTDKEVQDKKEDSSYKVLADLQEQSEEKQNDELEQRLENILETMVGVGKVKVLITYTQSSEVIAMYNENNTSTQTSETDSEGGTRTVEEKGNNKEVIFKEENGNNVPATQTIINPKVEGVIVTAEGANDATIKANIVSAVEAVTGAQPHKVQVFSMN